jgi:hypothetical protein
MVWCTPTGLRLHLGKSDLWDEQNAETPCRTLRSAARVELDLGAPCFEWLYLTEFEGRLSLHRGEATFRAATPFLEAAIETWVDARRNLWVTHCRTVGRGELADGALARIALERWGSRAFPGWYAGFSRDPGLGLGQARVRPEHGDLVLEEAFGGLRFAVVCRVLASGASATRISKHRGEIAIPGQREQDLTVLVAVVTSDEADEPAIAARALVDEVAADPTMALTGHRAWWAGFWERSFVHLPDDYLENLYYFKRYLMASGSRGRFPVLFNGGLWLWHGDVRNWVAPHHWNMQQAYWGLCPQGDAELLRPYLDAYWRLNPAASAFARERGAEDALLWSEAHDYGGTMPYQNRPDMLNNHTPASQIAGFFWEYYRYTGDRSFLAERAYPFMRRAAAFYAQRLQWDEARQEYFFFPSQSYECPETNQLRNPVTDRVMLEALLHACLEASRLLGIEDEEQTGWQHILDHLWPLETAEYPGIGRVLVEAYTPEGEIWWRHGDAGLDYHFSPQSAAVFPAGLIGLTDQGSKVYEAVRCFVEHHPPEKNSITPDPIVAARLGLGSQALWLLHNSIRRLQHFPQGLFYNLDHWHTLSRYVEQLADPALTAQRDYVYDRRCTYEGTGAPALPFVQCGLEPLGILGAAVNEMLLQSHDGVIRLFPAVPPDWECACSLWAVGGFRVSCRKTGDGVAAPVEIRSSQGGTCRMANPWPGQRVTVAAQEGSAGEVREVEGEVLTVEAVAGGRYLLAPQGTKPAGVPLYTGDPNPGPKRFHEAVLGRPRDF